jgi:hypothetical protein
MALAWWDACWCCWLRPTAVLHQRRCVDASLGTEGMTQHPAGHCRHLPHACANHIACNRCAGTTRKMSGQLSAGVAIRRAGAGQQLGATSAGASRGAEARLGPTQTRRHQVGVLQHAASGRVLLPLHQWHHAWEQLHGLHGMVVSCCTHHPACALVGPPDTPMPCTCTPQVATHQAAAVAAADRTPAPPEPAAAAPIPARQVAPHHLGGAAAASAQQAARQKASSAASRAGLSQTRLVPSSARSVSHLLLM